MSLELNEDLIHLFRDKVNQEAIFRELFRDVDGKNKWNIICSAMDWITVASEGLSNINMDIRVNFGYNHLETLNLMQYILCVDLLAESIIQLYRVLYNTTTYPLSEAREIFKQSRISDDKYFKHIRAVFTTHPVNLDSLDGIKSQTGERFYASWVAKDWLDENDFIVSLYSNNPLKDELNYFGVNIEDINRYVETRYNLLETLIKRVDQILDEHKLFYKKKKIGFDKNIIEQVKILNEENTVRFGFKYGYSSIIGYLLRMLRTELSSNECLEVVKKYKDGLITFIPKIKNGLQNMDIRTLSLPLTSHEYEFEKIYSYLYDHEHPLGERYFIKLIEKGILPSYLLTCDNFDERQLVLDAILYKEYRKRLSPISFDELII